MCFGRKLPSKARRLLSLTLMIRNNALSRFCGGQRRISIMLLLSGNSVLV